MSQPAGGGDAHPAVIPVVVVAEEHGAGVGRGVVVLQPEGDGVFFPGEGVVQLQAVGAGELVGAAGGAVSALGVGGFPAAAVGPAAHHFAGGAVHAVFQSTVKTVVSQQVFFGYRDGNLGEQIQSIAQVSGSLVDLCLGGVAVQQRLSGLAACSTAAQLSEVYTTS